jgi:multiple sugar transport system permease protein
MVHGESASPGQPLVAPAKIERAVPSDLAATARFWVPRAAIVASVVTGLVLAYTLPAVELADGATLSIQEANEKLTFKGDGWVLTLMWTASLLVIVAAIVFPRSERFIQTLAISAGSLVAMVFPFYVSRHLTLIDENAKGLGNGLIGAWIAFGVAAILPWFSLLWWNRERTILNRDWSKWLFMLPAILWILFLTVFPLIYAITTSRYVFRNGAISRFVGWDNYRRLFDIQSPAHDFGMALLIAGITAVVVLIVGAALRWLSEREVTRADLRSIAGNIPLFAVPAALVYLAATILKDPLGAQLNVTFIFVLMAVSVEMVLGFMIALLMNRELRARGVLRATMTLPIFATPIAIGYLFRTIFYEEGGPANALLANFGVSPPWISDPQWARVATAIVDIWQWTPFVFIIALAGLQSLPQDVVEASEVDGASGWNRLRYITLPLMAPILWLILLLRMIDAFKVFDIPQGLTLGGPGRATEYFSLFNYRTARKYFNYGDAAAQAFLLLFIVMVLVSLLWGRIRHVYEEDERRGVA